ncbi:hypothetical protein [Novosphingobium lentum]|uniref:hypothetical protein n=1 Tax=Novosphingobium lentum TaxID=145287 RepID=UPI0008331B97|nr:hypothetical protein [Novosphingobium lentum]
MQMFRFVTAHRRGKWYPELLLAQRQATAIGAGFFEARSGAFYQYPGTRLETRADEDFPHPHAPQQEIAA